MEAIMPHPYHHALSSVKKWGGTVEDYLIRERFTKTKMMVLRAPDPAASSVAGRRQSLLGACRAQSQRAAWSCPPRGLAGNFLMQLSI
jgi:hypothetical protein